MREDPTPMGACDCHVHVYGPFDKYATVEGKFSPIKAFPVESLFSMWDEIGVQRGVIVESNNAGPGNEMALDTLMQFPERLRGIAARKSDVSDRELDRLADAGFKDVGQLRHLQYLNATRIGVTDAGLRELKDLQELHSLNLTGAKIEPPPKSRSADNRSPAGRFTTPARATPSRSTRSGGTARMMVELWAGPVQGRTAGSIPPRATGSGPTEQVCPDLGSFLLKRCAVQLAGRCKAPSLFV